MCFYSVKSICSFDPLKISQTHILKIYFVRTFDKNISRILQKIGLICIFFSQYLTKSGLFHNLSKNDLFSAIPL